MIPINDKMIFCVVKNNFNFSKKVLAFLVGEVYSKSVGAIIILACGG